MRHPQAVLTAIVLVASGTMVLAQTPRFGVQGAISAPTNDLSNAANLGLQLGGHAKWDFRGGHGLMARADLTLYGSKDGLSTTSFGGGADYTYHVDRRQTGFYFLAGLTILNYRVSGSGDTDSSNGLGIDLGVGYDMDRNLGLQARYTTHEQDGATLSALNLGVTYTF